MLNHYITRGSRDYAVYVGVAGNTNGLLKMNWARCEDFTL